MSKKTKKPRRRASRQSQMGIALIVLIVLVLVVVLLIQCVNLRKKIKTGQTINGELETEIHEQEVRAKEIEDLPAYIQSDEYVEKTAREKFGLVYKDEIIFKPEE